MRIRLVCEVWRLWRNVFCLIIGLYGLPTAMLADDLGDYKLVKGDVLQIVHPASDNPVVQTIDIDGNLRLSGIGTVPVEGKTLRETEVAVENLIVAQDMYVAPKVVVSVEKYASVLVLGEVARPGQVLFFPGLTVGAVLALSGPEVSGAGHKLELSRAYTNVVGQIALIDHEVHIATNRIAALETALSESISTKDVHLATYQFHAAMPTLDSANSIWLKAEQTKMAATLAFLQKEAQAIAEQILLFQDRIEVENANVQIAERELEDALSLHSKGLQTSQQISALQRRSADIRSDLLGLETAKAQSSIALIKVHARKEQITAQWRAEFLAEMQLAQQAISAAEVRRKSLHTQLDIIAETLTDASLTVLGGGISFKLVSARRDRREQTKLGLETELLPGDTLFVLHEPAGVLEDG